MCVHKKSIKPTRKMIECVYILRYINGYCEHSPPKKLKVFEFINLNTAHVFTHHC